MSQENKSALDELIAEAQSQVDWYERKVSEEKLKLSVYYTARDLTDKSEQDEV